MIQAGTKHFCCWSCRQKWDEDVKDVYEQKGSPCPKCKDTIVYAYANTVTYPQTESDTDPPRS